ncbi:zinc-binding dehydrogenase [Fulvivirgaceae bacterium PWU37]|uniref:Zinc-binding dehydrogenase n=2 Tax=Dawidia soli TaxID=2782352 RepID=A0AAP2DDK1_9BACT|nr:zinc-binding dehydrogenase [Dawidia soli]
MRMREFYRVEKTGSLRNLKPQRSEIPVLEKGKVLVGVRSVGLNYADLFAIMGLYSATPQGPFIPGLEFSGDVLASDSDQFQVGQQVMGVTRFGGYDSHIVADPAYLFPLPEGWSYEEGAAFPVQTFTAYYALRTLGDLKPGQTVLIHSAAGGVGLQAHRIAKKYDAYTIGVVGSERKVELLTREGFDKTLVRGKHFRQALRQALGDRALNLVLETTGGKYFYDSYNLLAPMGRLVAYGSAQFTPASHRPNYISLLFRYLFRPRVDPLTMIKSNKSVMAFNLIWIYEEKELMHGMLRDIQALHLPPPVVGHRFEFSNMAAALALFQSGNTTGKVVLNIG